MAMVAVRCRPAIGLEYSSHACDAQTSIACSAPSKKGRVLFSMPSLLFLPFPLQCVFSLQAPGPGMCVHLAGGAPHQCIWPVAQGRGVLSPLLPLPFPHLPLLAVICPPPPRRPFAPASCNFSYFQTCGWCAQLTPSIARWWLFVPFLVLSTDVWGLCSDELAFCWKDFAYSCQCHICTMLEHSF
jgi:hypothetical protein